MAHPARATSDLAQGTWHRNEWTTWVSPAAPIPSQQAVCSSDHLNQSDFSTPNYSGLPPHVQQMLVRASSQLRVRQQESYTEHQIRDTAFLAPTKQPGSLVPQCLDPRLNPYQGVQTPHFDCHHPWQSSPTDGQTADAPGIIRASMAGSRFDTRKQLRVRYVAEPFADPPVPGRPRHVRPSTPAGPGYSYVSAPRTRFGDQQSNPRRRVQMQINYLDSLAVRIPSLHSLTAELQSKESLRARLAEIAQEAISSYAKDHGLSVGPNAIDLKCFGSLRNGFGLPGADMDLAMTSRTSSFPEELETECPRIIEKAFLDAGFGARLIPKTRVPIIKLCERPSEELLEALRTERRVWESKQRAAFTTAHPEEPISQPGLECTSQDSPPTDGHDTQQGSVGLEFPKSGVGIHCDINFSGRLAIYNSELLRCYSLCDERVRLVGVFIKKWAKVRKINSSYHGTMCSYGYILMVIHYLMNVANPPLIPNLQINYRPPVRGHKGVTTVEGCDIRFFNDEQEIKDMAKSNGFSCNNQSVGELVRGFFAYYGSQGHNAPLGGFDWVQEVISIRTRGGIIAKADKGWTSLKVDEKGNRHRYLLAIEDPFELDHNVARTVVQNGLLAIRGEFRRANKIINTIQEIPGVGWQWRTEKGGIGEDFFAEAEDRLHLQQYRRDHDRQGKNGMRCASYSWGEKRLSTPTSQSLTGVKEEACFRVLPTALYASKPNQTRRQGVHPVDSMLIPLSHQSTQAMEENTRQQAGIFKQSRAALNEVHHRRSMMRPLSNQMVGGSDSTGSGASGPVGSHSLATEGPATTQASRTVGWAPIRTSSQEKVSVCQVNPLIRPPVSEAARKQEEYKKQFEFQAATSADKMRRMLENQKAHALNALATARSHASPADPTPVERNEIARASNHVTNDRQFARKDQILNDARGALTCSRERSICYDIPGVSEPVAVKEVSCGVSRSRGGKEILGSDSGSDHTLLSSRSEFLSTSSSVLLASPATLLTQRQSESNHEKANTAPRPRGLVVDSRQLYETHSIHSGRRAPGAANVEVSLNQGSSLGLRRMTLKDEFPTPDAELLQIMPFNGSSVL